MPPIGRQPHKFTRTVVTALAVLVVALLPRVLALDEFLTTDERLWWGRSRDFFGGIIAADFSCPGVVENDATAVLEPGTGLECTLRAGHPGAITMWSGSLGIWLYYLSSNTDQTLLEFVQALAVDPIDPNSIFWLRLPTAVLYAVFAGCVFLILDRLLAQLRRGYWVALLASLFLALSPFNIALSRVLHTDALETVFLVLALLVAFYYWVDNASSRRWLFLSGALTGAAFVSKTPALFAMPFMALLGLWYLGRQWAAGRAGRSFFSTAAQVVIDGLLWFTTALGFTVLLWPALWVVPGTAIAYFMNVNFGYASRGHEKGNFFLGTLSEDPGFWFYPVNWLLHATPLVLLGVLMGLLFWLVGRRDIDLSEHRSRWAGLWRRLGIGPDATAIDSLMFLSLLFAFLFTAFLTLSTKKQDRYLLPVYPFMHIIAAIGWVWLVEYAAPWLERWLKKPLKWGYFVPLVVLILFFYAVSLRMVFPYYFTYFNPLLGGLRTAAQLTTVGWGEGLEQAAHYLNQKPDAEHLRVVSWYGSAFTPFFVGSGADYFEQKGRVLASDYVIVYINQRQRQLPDTEFFSFLESWSEPERVISLNGVPYVWLYPGVDLDHPLEYQRYDGVAELLGWEYTTPGLNPDRPVMQPGDTLEFELWWEYLGKPVEEAFFFWLVGADGQIWAETITHPRPDVGDPASWSSGKLVAESGKLFIPAGTPPGDFTVYLGFYPETPANPDDVLFFELDDNLRTVTIKPNPALDLTELPEISSLQHKVGSLHLIGYQLEREEFTLDQPAVINLYWQALEDLEAQYQVSLALVDGTGIQRWESKRVDPVTFHPTDQWAAGELVRSQLSLRPTVQTPGGEFDLVLNIYREEQPVATVPLRPVTMPGRVRQFSLNTPLEPVARNFGGKITLLGFRLEPDRAQFQTGDSVTVGLAWQPQMRMDKDYTLFVQLLGPDGQVYGQLDTQPLAGDHPTSHWAPGEIVEDALSFSIGQDAPPGKYQLITGFYDFETGQRLYTNNDANHVVLDSLLVR